MRRGSSVRNSSVIAQRGITMWTRLDPQTASAMCAYPGQSATFFWAFDTDFQRVAEGTRLQPTNPDLHSDNKVIPIKWK